MGVRLPYKKTGAFVSPSDSIEGAKAKSMLKLYPKGDSLNTQIAKAMEVANKVSRKTQSIRYEVEEY